ncbi:MAG TPA: zinc ABC transporter substrate-binding protein [Pseudomonadales bacterium]|nr:zinc ABC transporter substrate-binding protein [Pseudomonadales bacterium]
MKRLVAAFMLSLLSAQVDALEVFACEPEWGALVTELAGEHAEITVALTAFQDPHRLQARPSLIASTRRADLVVCTGAELEIGWLPLLLRRSGNPNIRAGTPGYFLAADYVRKLEVPTRLDRSQGDIHPQGNPHVHLSPHNITRIARKLTERLAELDPKNAAVYKMRLDDFVERWQGAIDTWEVRAQQLKGLAIVPHHRSFSYLAHWLGLDVIATVEAKPGIPPSGAHLSSLLEKLNNYPPVAVVRTPYANEKPTTWLAERLDKPQLVLPYTIGGHEDATNLFALFEVTLTLLEGLRP